VFDFFDDPRDRTNQVLAAIREHKVDVVVINKSPRFSGRMPPVLYDSLAQRFPASSAIGQFEVRWRA
jgi:hypothetical protein